MAGRFQLGWMRMDRRRFVGTVAMAAAGGWSIRAETVPGRTGCGLAIGTYGLQSMRLGEAVRLIADTGYDAVEISAMPGTTGDPSGLPTADREQLRSIIDGSGLRLCGIMAHLEPQRLDADHRAQLADLRHLIHLGHRLSPERPPVVQTVLGGKSWEESRDLFRDRIADWVQVAEDQRGTISVKPHRHHAMALPEQARWLISQLGSPARLGMVFDYSHYAFHDPELTVGAMVAESAPSTNYVAVKDAVLEAGKVHFALVGEGGSWDHADIVAAFHAKGYRGDFCCEVSSQIWRADGYDAVETTKRCYANLKAAFERAGVARG
ncbi:MAG TPA: TIM barrel protein [Bacteroidia bacterium]|nr:TIM barrel protein [Bacteroidia bacterium]